MTCYDIKTDDIEKRDELRRIQSLKAKLDCNKKKSKIVLILVMVVLTLVLAAVIYHIR